MFGGAFGPHVQGLRWSSRKTNEYKRTAEGLKLRIAKTPLNSDEVIQE